MKPIKQRLLVTSLLVLALGLGVLGGLVLDRQVLTVAAASASAPAGPNFQLIQDAWRIIQQQYVDRSALQSQSLTYGAINGMVDALGDTGHSRFLSPAMLKAEHN